MSKAANESVLYINLIKAGLLSVISNDEFSVSHVNMPPAVGTIPAHVAVDAVLSNTTVMVFDIIFPLFAASVAAPVLTTTVTVPCHEGVTVHL